MGQVTQTLERRTYGERRGLATSGRTAGGAQSSEHSAEERREKLTAAHDQLVAAVEAIATGEQWQQYLAFASRLHRYSARNVFLLHFQAAQRGWLDLGPVAGFRTWLSLGRHVKRGEKGLAILAPCTYRVHDDETNEDRFVLRGFRVEHVFAACQTDGDVEVPEPVRPALLTGDGPDGAWDAVSKQIEARGHAISRAPLSPANGMTDMLGNVVTVADRLEGAAAVKTAVHELAHVILHASAIDYATNRDRCEVEAESVAYLVCEELGLATDDYTFPYVAGWAEGKAELVMETAERVLRCAEEILRKFDHDDEGAPHDDLPTTSSVSSWSVHRTSTATRKPHSCTASSTISASACSKEV